MDPRLGHGFAEPWSRRILERAEGELVDRRPVAGDAGRSAGDAELQPAARGQAGRTWRASEERTARDRASFEGEGVGIATERRPVDDRGASVVPVDRHLGVARAERGGALGLERRFDTCHAGGDLRVLGRGARTQVAVAHEMHALLTTGDTGVGPQGETAVTTRDAAGLGRCRGGGCGEGDERERGGGHCCEKAGTHFGVSFLFGTWTTGLRRARCGTTMSPGAERRIDPTSQEPDCRQSPTHSADCPTPDAGGVVGA